MHTKHQAAEGGAVRRVHAIPHSFGSVHWAVFLFQQLQRTWAAALLGLRWQAANNAKPNTACKAPLLVCSMPRFPARYNRAGGPLVSSRAFLPG